MYEGGLKPVNKDCQEIVLELKEWFSGYVKRYQSVDLEYQQNIDLKEEHTKRVCSEILDIGKSLGLNFADLCLAEVMALFHDIGRFEQYAHYGTFLDFKSEDHAMLGVKVIREEAVLSRFDQSTQDLILRTIAYHNRADLPKDETERCLFFTRLLRDADKLDILRVVTDYYGQKDGLKNGAIELGLPDTPEISDDVCKDLMEGRIVSMSSLKTLNDFKLLQMGWIYDINFPRTFQCVLERGYLQMIRDVLPHSNRMSQIYSAVQSYLEQKC